VWQWVKGHTGHEFNERADALCTAEIKEIFAAMKKETI
jgi:ribonuclease HI